MNATVQRRIGLLGGTFDPVHNGHLGLAEEVLETFHLDRIVFVPACLAPHNSGGHVTPAQHRLAMLRLATESNPAFAVSEIELKRGGVSYTIETLKDLQSEHPEWDIHLIMGADTFNELVTWKEVCSVITICNLLIGSRPGTILNYPEKTLQGLFPDASPPYLPGKKEAQTTVFQHRETGTRLTFFEIRPRDISSSQIREKIAAGAEVKNWLPAEVENYIIDHRLY